MRIRISNTGSISTVRPFGKIDATTCSGLEAAINDLIDDGVARIILDLEETVYISSAGLRVILNAAKRLHGAGRIVISGVVTDVRNILDVAGIPDVIDVYADTKCAHDAFTR